MEDTNSVGDVREMFNGIEPMFRVSAYHSEEFGLCFAVSGDSKHEELFKTILEHYTPYRLLSSQDLPYKGKFRAKITLKE